MPNAEQTDAFKQGDAASYDDVADHFERYTERFTVPIAEALVAQAGLLPRGRVLDVGCGTGVLSRIAAHAVGAEGRVVGVDLSAGMLALAASLARADGVAERTEFRYGDAEQLDAADASFDAVISLYALRHFPRPQQALREMARVGRPGSPVVVGVGSAAPWQSMAFLRNGLRALRERAQGLGGAAPLYATRFLDGLLARHVPPETHLHGTADAVGSLAQAMRRAGFQDVRTRWVGQSSTIVTADDFWGLQVTLSTQARKAVPTLPAATLAALRQEFDSLCNAHLRRGGQLVYRSGALIASGRRPG